MGSEVVSRRPWLLVLLAGLGAGLVTPFIAMAVSREFRIGLGDDLAWLWPTSVCVMAISEDGNNEVQVLSIGIALNMAIYALVFLGLYGLARFFWKRRPRS